MSRLPVRRAAGGLLLTLYVKVEKHQNRIRAFDPLFRPPSEGALPQEQGLHFGARHGNVFAQSWAFLERITLIHVSRAWIDEPHPDVPLPRPQLNDALPDESPCCPTLGSR